MPRINAERLLSDLRHLRSIGAHENGVVRPAFSEADMSARRWLRSRFENAGLIAAIDGVGNVVGTSPNAGKAVLVGCLLYTSPSPRD